MYIADKEYNSMHIS